MAENKLILEKSPVMRYVKVRAPRYAVLDGPRAQLVLRIGKRARVVADVLIRDEDAFVADLLRAIAFVERPWRARPRGSSAASSAKELPRFGDLIRHLRRERGLRVEDVAARAGIRMSYLSTLETGRSKPPSARAVAALARALEQDEAWMTLLAWSEKVPPAIRGMLQSLLAPRA